MALWIADRKMGILREGRQLTPLPCLSLCGSGDCIFAAGEKRGFCIQRSTEALLYDFPLPGDCGCLFPLGGHICALSGDSDCLCAFSPADGRLCLSAPAGSYPRDVCPSPCGRYAAVAGSAAGEVMLFDRELHLFRRHRVPGAAVSVCFLPRGLAALCAVGEETITSRLYFISNRGVTEEVFSHPQPPCSLCALPGGKLLMGVHGSILHLSHTARLLGRTLCVYPSRIRFTQKGALFADGCQGGVYDLQGKKLFAAPEPVDFLAE